MAHWLLHAPTQYQEEICNWVCVHMYEKMTTILTKYNCQQKDLDHQNLTPLRTTLKKGLCQSTVTVSVISLKFQSTDNKLGVGTRLLCRLCSIVTSCLLVTSLSSLCPFCLTKCTHPICVALGLGGDITDFGWQNGIRRNQYKPLRIDLLESPVCPENPDSLPYCQVIKCLRATRATYIKLA